MINGSWYYFDGAGWMTTGWLKLGNNWYYLNPDNGAMATGWIQLGSTWYYMNGSGAMETDTGSETAMWMPMVYGSVKNKGSGLLGSE